MIFLQINAYSIGLHQMKIPVDPIFQEETAGLQFHALMRQLSTTEFSRIYFGVKCIVLIPEGCKVKMLVMKSTANLSLILMARLCSLNLCNVFKASISLCWLSCPSASTQIIYQICKQIAIEVDSKKEPSQHFLGILVYIWFP